MNSRPPQSVARSTTTGGGGNNGFEGSEFSNQFLFDEDNLEKFDINSLINNDDGNLKSPLNLIQVITGQNKCLVVAFNVLSYAHEKI